jgi:hypothetical protein
MDKIEKTDTSKSPLLKPVMQRDYTKGIGSTSEPTATPAPEPVNKVTSQQGPSEPGAQANFQKPSQENGPLPGDSTKAFSFDEATETSSDLGEGDQGPGVGFPTGSARTFANTIGNIVQIYLPRATYAYCKIDMENVRMNVEKGHLGMNWIEPFEEMNKSAEDGLKIPDESIKMWKAALQHFLEYKKVAFANPETEFYAATAVLLVDQGARAYSIKKQLEDYMRQALAESHPEAYVKQTVQPEQPKKEEPNEPERRAA